MGNDPFLNSINLRNRMKTSKGCLLMVARHEYRRLCRGISLRELSHEEIDFLADCQLFYHEPPLIPYEVFRESVLRYFDIDF